MFCSLCREAGCKNPFSQKGCRNFKTSALTVHVAGQDHREALCVPAQQKNTKKNTQKMEEMLMTAKEKGAIKRLEVVKWIVNEDLPLSKLQSMISLLKELKTTDIDMSEEECPSHESHWNMETLMWRGLSTLGKGQKTAEYRMQVKFA